MSSSSSSSGFSVPPGRYPPFSVVTDADHTAWIIIATALGLSCALLFGGIRIFVRCTVSPRFGLDDAFLAASTIVAVIQSSIVLGACSDDLGESIEIVPLGIQAKVQQMYYASILLFVVALGFSKISVVFFLLRLTVFKHHRRVFNAAAVLVTAWKVGSTFAVALQCNFTRPWIIVGERCSGPFLRRQIIGAFDIVSEIGLVDMAIYLVGGLYTSMSRKAVVVGAFGFRLPMIITIAFRLSTFNKAGRITNPTLLEDLFIVWTQTELNYSFISATILNLRPFVNNLNTQFGGLGEAESGNGYGYGSGSGIHMRSNGSYQMSNLKSVDRSNIRDEYAATQSAGCWDGQCNAYSYGISVPSTGVGVGNSHSGGKKNAAKLEKPREEDIKGDATSVGSNDSRRMIIRKDMSWKLEYEAN